MSFTTISLVNEGKAKWKYLNEGNNNMIVLFAITEQSIDEKYLKEVEMIGNKVFRILKSPKNSPLFSSKREQVEYMNLFNHYGMFNLNKAMT